jgi:hypothetical protein
MPQGQTESAARPAYFSRLRTPQGAVDSFHIAHFRIREVYLWLEEAGFAISSVRTFQDQNVFLCARPSYLPRIVSTLSHAKQAIGSRFR